MTVRITHHAVDRYVERVAPVSRAEAARAMHAADRAIETAAAFGARIVRLSSGARLICRGRDPVRVVTVLERGCIEGGRFPRLPVHALPQAAQG